MRDWRRKAEKEAAICAPRLLKRGLPFRGRPEYSSLRSFRFQRALCRRDQLAESRGICGSDIGENLSIQTDLGCFEAFHKSAVGDAGSASGGVDADLPKCPEITLLSLAISECVLAAMIQRISSIPIQFAAAHPKAFGGFN